jgi:hypothetical protein
LKDVDGLPFRLDQAGDQSIDIKAGYETAELYIGHERSLLIKSGVSLRSLAPNDKASAAMNKLRELKADGKKDAFGFVEVAQESENFVRRNLPHDFAAFNVEHLNDANPGLFIDAKFQSQTQSVYHGLGRRRSGTRVRYRL